MEKLTEEDVKKRYIEPSLKKSGWTFDRIKMEKRVEPKKYFTDGKIIVKGKRTKRGSKKRADYLLHHHNNYPIAIIEAKDNKHSISSGIQQAIDYARTLDVPFAYSTNGKGYSEHNMLTGKERELTMDAFPTSDELWNLRNEFYGITEDVEEVIKTPYFFREGSYSPRYYQRIAVNRTVEKIANIVKHNEEEKRAMLVMATGTGKTFTAFQIIHRLYKAGVVKKVLYLADRNVLIDQTIVGDFAEFKNKNILTKVVKRNMDSAYDIFMSLYQQLSGDENEEAFLQFDKDFFDLIIVDECHRGSAKENSAWRKILNYYRSAIHLGMTATPKETEDTSNSKYFGDAIYTYSLKEGIDDGFLAPYRVLRIGIDKDLEGYIPEKGKIDVYGQEVEQRVYNSKDFDKKLIIDERTKQVAKRVSNYLKNHDRYAKTIIFCVDIDHADRMRQALVNENSDLCTIDDRYVMKITGDDDLGKAQLENFIDVNSKYPTIVTTSELLSTGVDCKMCKVIVLDNVIKSMTKFKQIIGRGTRLVWDRDKRFFTIIDFRKATMLFSDPEFDGPATSVYDPDDPTTKGTEDDPFGENRDDDGLPYDPNGDDVIRENEAKYRVNDVDAKIISELEFVYGPDGKLVANNTANFKQLILKKYETFEDFHNDWMNNSKLDIYNYFEENGVDFADLKDKVGSDVDIYDILLMIGFEKDAKLKSERIANMKDSEYYLSIDSKLYPVIDKLMQIYLEQEIFVLEKIDVLELSTFDEYGGITKVAKMFGRPSRKKYFEIISNLINEIYQ